MRYVSCAKKCVNDPSLQADSVTTHVTATHGGHLHFNIPALPAQSPSPRFCCAPRSIDRSLAEVIWARALLWAQTQVLSPHPLVAMRQRSTQPSRQHLANNSWTARPQANCNGTGRRNAREISLMPNDKTRDISKN